MVIDSQIRRFFQDLIRKPIPEILLEKEHSNLRGKVLDFACIKKKTDINRNILAHFSSIPSLCSFGSKNPNFLFIQNNALFIIFIHKY
jgi:hypothetical protein